MPETPLLPHILPFHHFQHGGAVPGSSGCPAFTLYNADTSAMPVLIAAPHGGREYAAQLRAMMRNPGQIAHRLEDRHVDLLARAVAGLSGAPVLVAHAPRALIDLNRGIDDMDWDMVEAGHAPPGWSRTRLGRRAGTGLGLIPRRLGGVGDLWIGPISAADLANRLARVHRPYHAMLADTLGRMRERWGAALLIDLHSMPPLAEKDGGAHFVIGDRFGASCAGALSDKAIGWLAGRGQRVAHNRPYAGGYVLDCHGAPDDGVHAIQIEVCRSRYLDSLHREPGQGLGPLASMLAELVHSLATETAAIGHGFALPLAAE